MSNFYNYVYQFGPYKARPDKCMVEVTVSTLLGAHQPCFLFKYSMDDLK